MRGGGRRRGHATQAFRVLHLLRTLVLPPAKTLEEIRELSGVSTRQTRRDLAVLEKAGFVLVRRPYDNRGRFSYRIVPSMIAASRWGR